MPQAATYYPDLSLVHIRVWDTVGLASLSARMAEWMYDLHVPEGYCCLTDLRQLIVLDQARTGMPQLVAMQARIYEDIPCPEKSAIIANSPVGIVAGRLFEQLAEGVLDEKVRVFREEQPALGFLGFRANGIEPLLGSQENMRQLD